MCVRRTNDNERAFAGFRRRFHSISLRDQSFLRGKPLVVREFLATLDIVLEKAA
jgi:hypothetical protein